MIALEAGDAWLTVHPEAGGRIGSIEVGGTPLLRDDPSAGALMWGCYPMVPWAGRVRHGAFNFDGIGHQLPINLPPHAIHGTAFDARWEVVDAGRDYCELRCALTWQFGGTAHQHVQLRPDGVTCVLTAYATAMPMPAVVGWHPCFRKPAADELSFGRMYPRDHDGMAVLPTVDPVARPWDDCFVEPQGPLRLRFRDHHGGAIVVTVASDCDHWVVYDEPADATCVEPQSAPPDAFNLGGATRLDPGDLLQRTMIITWQRSHRVTLP
jgi:aldose 1-epimerase